MKNDVPKTAIGRSSRSNRSVLLTPMNFSIFSKTLRSDLFELPELPVKGK